ncbi:MAG TPA: hypothetical protein ACFYD1_01480 [Candidatus Hypogeohydataceae bacterium YC38]|nr:hypothetical protein [Candidatus Brocadiales bacterium]
MIRAKIIAITIIVSMLAMVSTACAGEHPTEHPREHPAKPAKKEEVGLTKETLAEAITDYVQKDTALKGGVFLVYDQVDEKPLVLSLVKVHKDRLSAVGKGVYFACADFTTPEGVLYDLDFFMKETDRKLEVTEITVHKVTGKPRYNWVEKEGIWVREGL